ncbi:MAG: monovalent cation/H(+) antiporter subunit G [Magnetococcales bacterium]|nr:monovalent cation/H(+) antiporter subunit G [Magnetococcales bacterium]
MDVIIHVISGILMIAGGILMLISAIGVLRFPDLFTRMHAAGINDTLGAGLVLLGLLLVSGWTLATVKLIMIIGLFYFTSPVSTHALAQAALSDGEQPELPSQSEQSNLL